MFLVAGAWTATLIANCGGNGATGGSSGTPADGGSPAIWTPRSLGFVLVESGGGTMIPGGFGQCAPSSPTWSFDSGARSLTRTACSAGQSLDAKVALSADAANRVVNLLSSVREGASETPVCGGDGAQFTLKVLGPNGAQDYQSCMGAGPGPLVSFNDLANLASQLDADLAGCAPDGGSGTSAIDACTQVGPAESVDAGSADVSVMTDP
jgi:hypothetical protein